MAPEPSAPKKLGAADYIVAGLCLVPVLNLLVGLAALVLGIVKIRRGGWLLILAAFLGFGITTGLGYWGYSAIFDDTNGLLVKTYTQMAPEQLTELVQALETFKTQNGHYPATLKELPRTVLVLDMLASRKKWGHPQEYFYEALPDGNTYYLFSRGVDAEAFTADDLQPKLSPELTASSGWRLRPDSFASLQASPVPATAVAEAPGGAAPAGAAPTSAFWRTPAQGMAEAKASGKLVLYDLSAEWCGPCNRLNAEVFENAQYKAQILSKFIPVHVVDRRREEGKNPTEVEDLQKKYALRAFPTLIVQSASSSDFRKMEGYGGADRFMFFLDSSANELKGK
jgi:thiol-disulfide isomerase/thioredoxin